MSNPLFIDSQFIIYTDRLNLSIEIINIIEEYRGKLASESYQDLEKILELNSILITANYAVLDSLVILKSFTSKKEDTAYWERLFHVKNAYLLIHEFFSSYNKRGKFLYEILSDDAALETEFEIFKNAVKEFRSNYANKVGEVRNLVSAHIDRDWAGKFKLISTINNSEDADMVVQFYHILNNLSGILVKLLIGYSSSDFNLNDLLEMKYRELLQKQV